MRITSRAIAIFLNYTDLQRTPYAFIAAETILLHLLQVAECLIAKNGVLIEGQVQRYIQIELVNAVPLWFDKKMGLCWEFNKHTLRELYNCPARPLTNCIDGRFLMRNTKAQRARVPFQKSVANDTQAGKMAISNCCHASKIQNCKRAYLICQSEKWQPRLFIV